MEIRINWSLKALAGAEAEAQSVLANAIRSSGLWQLHLLRWSRVVYACDPHTQEAWESWVQVVLGAQG